MVLTIEPADAVQEAEVSERERPRACGSLGVRVYKAAVGGDHGILGRQGSLLLFTCFEPILRQCAGGFPERRFLPASRAARDWAGFRPCMVCVE